MSHRVRSVFLSDSHLGQKFARGEELLAFLNDVQPDYLYLVGDFIDAWCIRWSGYWPATYTKILERLIELTALGTKIRYTPGNHDAFLRRSAPSLPGVQFSDQFIHQTADNRRLLVIHGDLLDSIERQWKWLSRIGSFLFNRIIDVNLALNFCLKSMGLRPVYFSFSIKRLSKRMLGAFGRFQRKLIDTARKRGLDGIVCGHVHFPRILQSDGTIYINTGDWLENASALIEYSDGMLELRNHNQIIGQLLPRSAVSPNARPVITLGSEISRESVPGAPSSGTT